MKKQMSPIVTIRDNRGNRRRCADRNRDVHEEGEHAEDGDDARGRGHGGRWYRSWDRNKVPTRRWSAAAAALETQKNFRKTIGLRDLWMLKAALNDYQTAPENANSVVEKKRLVA